MAALPVGEAATTTQNIAKARSKRRGQSVTGELANLSDKFSAIYGEVQNKVTDEHEQQEERLQSVEDHISRIQTALMVEQHRRVQMLKQVETNLQDLYDKVAGECTAQLEALRPDIPDRISSWHGRLDDCFTMLAEEKVARQIVINRERLKLLKTVDDFEKQLEIEKVERLERETSMVQKVSQEIQELQEVCSLLPRAALAQAAPCRLHYLFAPTRARATHRSSIARGCGARRLSGTSATRTIRSMRCATDRTRSSRRRWCPA